MGWAVLQWKPWQMQTHQSFEDAAATQSSAVHQAQRKYSTRLAVESHIAYILDISTKSVRLGI